MKKAHRTPEEMATRRFEIISGLLDPGLTGSGMFVAKKHELEQRYQVSYRSLSRWYQAYQEQGFKGLIPKATVAHCQTKQQSDEFAKVVDAAIELRRECPTRSVRTIISILELEGVIEPDSVSRSTLQRHLQKRGFGTKQVNMYRRQSPAARRFQKTYRGQLYQGDIKYGPYLPLGPHGKMVQTYMAAWLDDATRFVVHAEFYANQKVDIIEDSLRQALMSCGQPEAIYVDNGKQYRSNWLRKACARLGIKLLHAKPYHPEGKGKIERFNRSLDAFLAECALQKPKTLAELNANFRAWLQSQYQKAPHGGLKGMSPLTAWQLDRHMVRLPFEDELREAFLHTEARTVDKTGCISFNGQQYEVGLKLIGRQVEVCYDPTWQEEVEIHHKDFAPFRAHRLAIGENCQQAKEVPQEFKKPTDHSRLLDALRHQSKAETAKAARGHATDFSNLVEEVTRHV